MQELRLKIGKMSCVNCSTSIEKLCKKIDGVSEASVSFVNSSGVFLLEKENLKDKIVEKIRSLGFEVLKDEEDIKDFKLKELNKLKYTLVSSIFISLVCMLFNMYLHSELSSLIQLILGVIGIFYCGKSFFINAFKALLHKSLDMNTLVSLGLLSAFSYSMLTFLGFFNTHLYFAEASMIVSFVLLGKFLEENAKLKALSYQKNLQSKDLKYARILDEKGEERQILSSLVKEGDIMLLKQGDTLSADGVVINGEGELDTSAINGEFVPVLKSTNDELLAGCVLVSGMLKVRASKKAMDSKIELIKDLVFKASEQKLPISRIVDKISAYFVAFIIFISACVFAFWFFKSGLNEAFLHTSAVLLISCPCALGLATPLALVLALSNAMKSFVLIKNPASLEHFRKVKFALFDKTGTLTKDSLELFKHNLDEKDFLLAANIEKLSSHPIGKALAKYSTNKSLSGKVSTINSRAMLYEENNDTYALCNKKFIEEQGFVIEKKDEDFVRQNSRFAPVLVYFVKNGTCKGVICLKNELRKESYGLISYLKEQNITPVILSGDNENSVALCAKELGIKQYYSNLSVEDKIDFVKKYQEQGLVLFVGDGINDSAALKLANISVVMNNGSDFTKNVGDFILLEDDLSRLKYCFELSKKSFAIIKQNLFWASIYNGFCIPIAAGFVPFIKLSPHLAALAMCFSSLTVVLNSLRLRGFKA